MKTRGLTLCCALLIATALQGQERRVEATWKSLNGRGYTSWFGAVKPGIFVHWGLYSVPAYA